MRNCFRFLALVCVSTSLLAAQPETPLKTRALVDLAPSELMAQFPELKKLDFAQTQDELPRLLEEVGDRVQALFRDFPNTSSLERVRLQILNYRGQAVRSANREYQYLVIAHPMVVQSKITPLGGQTLLTPEEKKMKFEEYRTDKKGVEVNIHKLEGFFLMSKGYAGIPLFFHPMYRAEAVFRYLGRETAGSRAYVIGFSQRVDVARLAASFHSSTGPLRFWVQGIAWVDPASSQIARMRTDRLKPLVEVDLQQNTTEIQLQQVQFRRTGRALWLPREVVVTTRWRGGLFRNAHQYSNYKLFTVDAKDDQKHTIVSPKPSPARP